MTKTNNEPATYRGTIMRDGPRAFPDRTVWSWSIDESDAEGDWIACGEADDRHDAESAMHSRAHALGLVELGGDAASGYDYAAGPDGPIVRCRCGDWSGQACDRVVPAREAVTVEWMPRCHRASHEAAHNSGVWPHNGAERSRVARGCADAMIEADGDWCEIVEDSDR